MADYITAEPLFDWDKGDFVIVGGRPRLAIGKERVKNWIQKVLHTQRDKYGIYKGTGFGTDTESITGKTFARDYMQSEIKREITETLLKNDSIISIDNFSMERDGSKLIISFTVITEYGTESIKEEW